MTFYATIPTCDLDKTLTYIHTYAGANLFSSLVKTTSEMSPDIFAG